MQRISRNNFGATEGNFFLGDVPLGRNTNFGTTFGRPAPLKFGRAKNVKNWARFRTTSDFDREYLQND